MLLHCKCYAMAWEGGCFSSQFQNDQRLRIKRKERAGEGEGCKVVSLGTLVDDLLCCGKSKRKGKHTAGTGKTWHRFKAYFYILSKTSWMLNSETGFRTRTGTITFPSQSGCRNHQAAELRSLLNALAHRCIEMLK